MKSAYLLNVSVAHVVAVAEHRDNESGGGGYSDGDVDEVSVDDLVLVDDSVDNWLLLEGGSGCLDECGHEAELDVVLLGEGLADLLADVHEAAHVNLVEGGEHGVSVLSLLQSLGYSDAHARHGHAGLSAGASDA